MVPGGFKRFPDGEKAERVQDHHAAAIAWSIVDRTLPASYWLFIVFFKL
jgi:hypothetical protein